MSQETPQQIIQRALGRYLVPGTHYPTALPPELEPWHCYTQDGGHAIFIVIPSLAEESSLSQDLVDEAMVPAPVKAVLRAGYEVRDGRIWCELPYDNTLGLVAEPGDDEF